MTDSKIDENLYSRQLGVFGHEAMGKLMKLDVLIVGLKGIGIETAKNLILAGPRSVTVYDPEPAVITDLQSDYYLRPEQVGTRRDVASLPPLRELNEYVITKKLEIEGELTEEILAGFHVVVVTGALPIPGPKLAAWSAFCHANKIGFISTALRGLAGSVFVDFGPDHTIFDKDGELCKSAIVTNILRTPEGVATVFTHDAKRHGFEDGDFVVFREIDGTPEFNDGKPRRITNTKMFSFDLAEPWTGSVGAMSGSGVVEQVKVTSKLEQFPLSHVTLNPVHPKEGSMLFTDYAKMTRPSQLHVAFNALQQFADEQGRLPGIRNAADAAAVVALAKAFVASSSESLGVTEVEEDVVTRLSFLAATELPALAAFFGGIVAQEVVKFTGKFTPLNQLLYMDAFEVGTALTAEGAGGAGGLAPDFAPSGSKYDNLTAIFGKEFIAKLGSQKVFLVGAGALGCEFLKNFAMMGLSCGDSGLVTVTDMDRIEKSNLNRQFLFRNVNVGQPKSATAAAAARVMNPDLKVTSSEIPVGPDTEGTFDDAFWEQQTLITNALDNLKARLYVDGRCVFYRKPLMESGTLGTKANTQVIIPFHTESYGDSVDPPEESIPMCTLRNFPHLIEHCIEWARDQFEACFVSALKDAAAFKHDPAAWMAALAKETNSTTKRAQLQGVVDAIENSLRRSPAMCVLVARLVFNTHYNITIRQLLHNFPVDYVDSSGMKFWSGPKRAPEALVFDASDPAHLSFIASAAQILANSYGVTLPEGFESFEVLKPFLDEVESQVPPFAPRVVRIKTREDEAVAEGGDDDEEAVRQLSAKLESFLPSLSNVNISAAEFEKDDDSNGHINFVTAASNLRARNYKIKEASRHQVKMIAGKIVPAIATTTCMITGLVCLEIYKVLKGGNADNTHNSYVNLAVNVYSMANPQPPKKNVSKEFDPVARGPVKALPEGFSSWDRTIVNGDFTCAELSAYMEKTFTVSTQMISAGPKLLFAPMLYASHKKRADRKVREVYEEVAGPIAPGRRYIVLDLTMDDDGVDVITPQVQLFFA